MKKGFTLIDLLVTIAIIGLLVSVVLMVINVAKNKNKVLTEDPETYCKEQGLTMQLSELPATCQQYFK